MVAMPVLASTIAFIFTFECVRVFVFFYYCWKANSIVKECKMPTFAMVFSFKWINRCMCSNFLCSMFQVPKTEKHSHQFYTVTVFYCKSCNQHIKEKCWNFAQLPAIEMMFANKKFRPLSFITACIHANSFHNHIFVVVAVASYYTLNYKWSN